MKFEKNKWVKKLTASTYRGRFAPSPTGSLHLGSLYTALASFLQARSKQGTWLVRIDDLDTPRNQAGASDSILKTLERCGLHWDETVYYQSDNIAYYNEILQDLINKGLIYRCQCSRKILLNTDVYNRTCLHQQIPASLPHALRLKTDERILSFQDELQGLISDNIAMQHGDFIIKRKDNIIAYPFTVVIDDNVQGINHIVRGVDLLNATPKQIYLQQVLTWNTPHYAHVPLIIDSNGQKLSKQNLAKPVNNQNPARLLFQLLILLKQNPPHELQYQSVEYILKWAIEHWQMNNLKNIISLNEDDKD